MKMNRRALIQILGVMGPAASASAQEHVDQPPRPRYFGIEQYKLLGALCQYIIPADAASGGAIEGGVPEFVDLLARENAEYRRILSGGMLWLDAFCMARFGTAFLHSTEAQRREILDLISTREGALRDSGLLPGVQFFAFLRNLTLDGYFTSKEGIQYLQFQGNGALARFDGCPTAR